MHHQIRLAHVRGDGKSVSEFPIMMLVLQVGCKMVACHQNGGQPELLRGAGTANREGLAPLQFLHVSRIYLACVHPHTELHGSGIRTVSLKGAGLVNI